MAEPLGNPFEKKQPIPEPKRRNLRYRTVYYNLLEVEDRANLQTDLSRMANDVNKFGLTEFSVESKVDGTPYVMARYWDDQDLEPKTVDWFDINVRMYAHYQFEELDSIVNRHDNRTLRLLGEKRFTYKTGEVVVILFWAEIRSTARTQEALDALRSVLSR